MAAEFRPFLETTAAKAAGGGTPFSPLPASSASPAPVLPAAAPPAKCGEPRIELKRDGDRVTEIRVHCRCGDVIELACEY